MTIRITPEYFKKYINLKAPEQHQFFANGFFYERTGEKNDITEHEKEAVINDIARGDEPTFFINIPRTNTKLLLDEVLHTIAYNSGFQNSSCIRQQVTPTKQKTAVLSTFLQTNNMVTLDQLQHCYSQYITRASEQIFSHFTETVSTNGTKFIIRGHEPTVDFHVYCNVANSNDSLDLYLINALHAYQIIDCKGNRIENQPHTTGKNHTFPAIVEILKLIDCSDSTKMWKLESIYVTDPLLEFHLNFGIYKALEILAKVINTAKIWEKNQGRFNSNRAQRAKNITNLANVLSADVVEIVTNHQNQKKSKYILFKNILNYKHIEQARDAKNDITYITLLDALKETKPRSFLDRTYSPYEWAMDTLKRLEREEKSQAASTQQTQRTTLSNQYKPGRSLRYRNGFV